MSEPRVLMPLFLDVSDKRVLVVGGGVIAARKVAELRAARAEVHVVAIAVVDELASPAPSAPAAPTAPAAHVELPTAPAAHVELRPFEERDIDGAWLVIAATDDRAVQQRIAIECQRRSVFCVAIDDPPNASAYGGAIVRRGPVTIAISTSGEAPAVARLLRELLEQVLPDEGFLDAARALREKWRADKTPMTSRFGELVTAFKERASPKT